MNEVMQFLNDAGVYYIASVDADGKPHARPFGSRIIYQDKFYIFMGFPKAVYDQVMANPYVQLVTMGKDRAWIRISATATPVLDVDKRTEILDSRVGARPANAAESMVFELTEVTAIIYGGEEQTVITW
ncbi:MAG: pyridoxamine 5'-phosphate oxidase family protein [Coriobacteriia bacterium]|nr:pyridoxamine 5'-phosphate oxidase family protein [Coriobacteriia bacterium]